MYVHALTISHNIEECLNGVDMQKTDIHFVHHVIDYCKDCVCSITYNHLLYIEE